MEIGRDRDLAVFEGVQIRLGGNAAMMTLSTNAGGELPISPFTDTWLLTMLIAVWQNPLGTGSDLQFVELATRNTAFEREI